MKIHQYSYCKSKLLPCLWFPNLSMFSTFRDRQHCATAQCILASWQHFSNEDELPDLSQSFRKKSMSIWFFSSSENGVAHIFNSNFSSRWSPLVQLFWVKNGSKFHSSLIFRIIFRESRIVNSWNSFFGPKSLEFRSFSLFCPGYTFLGRDSTGVSVKLDDGEIMKASRKSSSRSSSLQSEMGIGWWNDNGDFSQHLRFLRCPWFYTNFLRFPRF